MSDDVGYNRIKECDTVVITEIKSSIKLQIIHKGVLRDVTLFGLEEIDCQETIDYLKANYRGKMSYGKTNKRDMVTLKDMNNKRSLQGILLEEGLAKLNRQEGGVLKKYITLQKAAKAAGKGIWSSPITPP